MATIKKKKPLVKSKPTKAEAATELRAFRSGVAKLKKLGLVSKRVDARSQKPTRYMKGELKRFNRVLTGKEAAVSVPTRADARQFKDDFTVKFKRVIRTKSTKDEKFYYSKRTKEFTTKRKDYGQKAVLSVVPGTVARLRKYDGLPGVAFIQPFYSFATHDITWRPFANFDALYTTMQTLYEAKGYRNWWQHTRVEIIKGDADDYPEEEDEE